MDKYLIDYLKSGKAWVLVGAGPSYEMGYPSWEKLASLAIEVVKIEGHGCRIDDIETAMRRKDYPLVFEEAIKILGASRILQYLYERLKPSQSGRIYDIIARWPIPVYLTTNYDCEIENSLARLRLSYRVYNNSEDHLGHLLPLLDGAIVKLHGDLRSEKGLILTKSQYRQIEEDEDWKYWRTKMTSMFQFHPVVIIGHSLSDINIRHVLQAAKTGSGVSQPVCWIAPDVSRNDIKDYLEKFRIRVITYNNERRDHKNLLQLLETINNFIPPRTAIHIQKQIAEVSQSPLGGDAAAPGFFVFNKLGMLADVENKRCDIMVAIIQAIIPKLLSLKEFTLEEALQMGGWPKDLPIPPELAKQVSEQTVAQELLVEISGKFRIGNKAESIAADNKKIFDHTRERFQGALKLRIKRHYPDLSDKEVSSIAFDIDASLTGYFKEGGLSLATTLCSVHQTIKQITVPASIIKFITEASARYDSLLKRQAFVAASIDTFVQAPNRRNVNT